MIVIQNVKVELTVEERKTLRDAQLIWQDIYPKFDENGVDIAYITNCLDKELSDLLDCCENGVGLEW